MNIEDQQAFLQLDTVRFSDEGVYEMDGSQIMVFVPRIDIRGLESVVSCSAERPLAALILGLFLLALSATPVFMFLNVFLHGGTFRFIFIWMVAFSVPAISVLNSLRKRHIILVRKRSGSRKLVFQKCSNSDEIGSFIAEAKRRYGFA